MRPLYLMDSEDMTTTPQPQQTALMEAKTPEDLRPPRPVFKWFKRGWFAFVNGEGEYKNPGIEEDEKAAWLRGWRMSQDHNDPRVHLRQPFPPRPFASTFPLLTTLVFDPWETLKVVAPCCAPKDLRKVLRGGHFWIDPQRPNAVRVEATEGKIGFAGYATPVGLSLERMEVPEGVRVRQAIISLEALKDIAALVGKPSRKYGDTCDARLVVITKGSKPGLLRATNAHGRSIEFEETAGKFPVMDTFTATRQSRYGKGQCFTFSADLLERLAKLARAFTGCGNGNITIHLPNPKEGAGEPLVNSPIHGRVNSEYFDNGEGSQVLLMPVKTAYEVLSPREEEPAQEE